MYIPIVKKIILEEFFSPPFTNPYASFLLSLSLVSKITATPPISYPITPTVIRLTQYNILILDNKEENAIQVITTIVITSFVPVI